MSKDTETDKRCSDIIITQATSQKELEEIWNIDCEAYGEANISKDILRKWWGTYPEGLYIVKKNGAVVGGFGIWPIAKDAYDNLKNGSIKELELTVLNKNLSKSNYWYISGIVIMKKYRRTKILWCMLYVIIKHWYETQVKSNSVIIGSIPISDEGKDLLTRHGFFLSIIADERKNHFPFFEKTISKKYIEKIIARYD